MKDQIVENYVGRNLSETGAISAQRCSEIFATLLSITSLLNVKTYGMKIAFDRP